MSESLITSNPSAKVDYFFEEVVEAGIVLTGTEIKSIRDASPSIKEAYVEILGVPGVSMEAFLVQAHIPPYKHGNIWNHEPLRKRKLLLHRHQIHHLFVASTQKGFTIIPTKMYFSKGRVKVELALGKGKKSHDKRQDVQKKDAEREISRALKQRQR